MTLILDHIAISAGTLEAGVAFVESALGLSLAGGGHHPHMATHNRLLGVGDVYLEVIAADPSAQRPAWPRWFDLDGFLGPPRLTNWICRAADLDAALDAAPAGTGRPVSLQRGDYRWRMAVPEDGRLPFDNAFPALIEWQGSLHPAKALPDTGARLVALEIFHPRAEALGAALTAGGFADPRVTLFTAPHKAMRAVLSTPGGIRVLT